MKREYTREEFEKTVNFLQEKVKGISISTDIICGFPTEEDEHFEESLSLCEKFKFPSLYISQFYPR
jgi:threonylcarbamoyladenosine tRNA methylthiotransferase CDKAL1